MRRCFDRVTAVDPYAAALVLQPDADVPDPNWLKRLDYSTAAQTTFSQATPDWVQDLGDVSSLDMGSIFQEPLAAAPAPTAPAQSVQDVPEWFAPAAQEPSGASAPLEADWLGAPGAESGSELSDWFSELGAPSAGTAQPSANAPLEADWLAGFDDLETPGGLVEETAQPASAAPVEADWLTDFDTMGGAQPSLDQLPEPPDIPAEAASDLDWLIPDAAVSEPTGVMPPEAAPPGENWLSGFDEVDISSFEVVEEEEPTEFGWPAEETLPGELEAALGASAETEWSLADEFPAKMADTGLLDDERPPSGFTDILAGIEPRFPATDEVEPTPPEWLVAFSEEGPAPTEPASELPAAEAFSWEEPETEGQPAAAEAASLSDFEALFATPREAPSAPVAETPPIPPQSIPDWLTEPESDFFARPQEQPAADDWFSGLEEVDETAVADVSGSAEISLEPTAALDQAETDEEDWFAADDEGFTAALEEVRDMQPETEISEAPSDWEMAPEGDMGWLTGQETADQVQMMPETDSSEALAAELPDWIQSAAPEGQRDAEPPAPIEAEIPVVEDWSQLDVGAEFEIGEQGEAPVSDGSSRKPEVIG
jgi:hypothetical protein